VVKEQVQVEQEIQMIEQHLAPPNHRQTRRNRRLQPPGLPQIHQSRRQNHRHPLFRRLTAQR
jgi:hypothetical protein